MNPAIMPHLTKEHLDGRWFEDAVRASRRRETVSVLAVHADFRPVKASDARFSPNAAPDTVQTVIGCKPVVSLAR